MDTLKPNKLAQWIVNQVLRLPDSQSGELLLRIWRQVRIKVANRLDFPVRYTIRTVPLLLPLSHDLPHIRKLSPNYSGNLVRISALLSQKYPGFKLIDIGANVGDTVALLRSHATFPILCVEGAPKYLSYLRENVRQHFWDNVEIEDCFVDSGNGQRHGSLKESAGTAEFQQDGNGATLVTRSLTQILERHPDFCSAKLLKIDTDGFDGRIIEGSIDWISAARPVIFWEYYPCLDHQQGGPGKKVFKILRDSGYVHIMFFDNNGNYLMTINSGDQEGLSDISNYFGGWKGAPPYADLCAFTEQDADICKATRHCELENYERIGQKISSALPRVE